MTPSEQQIIDQLRAAAAEWMARRKQDGPQPVERDDDETVEVAE